jgi:hypothetical protein
MSGDQAVRKRTLERKGSTRALRTSTPDGDVASSRRRDVSSGFVLAGRDLLRYVSIDDIAVLLAG